MKYLTPELYVRISEANADEVERLYEEWNAAGANARAHVEHVKDKLPPKMREFLETMCLHDADVVGVYVSTSRNGMGTPVGSINVRQDGKLIWLVYDLYNEPAISRPVASDVFVSDPAERQWLYDEVELVDEAKYRHSIFLNTGEVIDLDFIQFDMFIHHSPPHGLVAHRVQSP